MSSCAPTLATSSHRSWILGSTVHCTEACHIWQVRRIEERVGNLTGLDRHNGEVDMKLTAHASRAPELERVAQPAHPSRAPGRAGRRSAAGGPAATRAYSLHHEKVAR